MENKYIHLISKYIDKQSLNIVISSTNENKVIDYLKNNNYNIIIKKESDCVNEINSIIDLIIKNKYSNIFIGHLNPIIFNELTLGYCLYKMLDTNTKKILIDTNDILHEEYTL